MATTYQNLINKSGTVYNTQSGQGYSNPTQLAGDLDVAESGIQWGSIRSDPGYTPGSKFGGATPAISSPAPVTQPAASLTPSAPQAGSQPQPVASPTSPQLQAQPTVTPTGATVPSSQLIGQRPSSVDPKVMESYNTQTGQGFSDPSQLSQFVNSQYGAQTTPENIFTSLQKGFVNAMTSGEPVPKTQGEAQSAIKRLTPPGGPNFANMEQQLAQDPGYQQLLADRAEFNSVASQGKSLLEFYSQAVSSAGISGINEQLLNHKRIIEGTEDDIRQEVQAVSGFATESQVLALSSARNKSLIKNYNNLLDTKSMAMEQVNNMVNLASQDRQFAQQSIQQKMQIDQQISEYRDKFVRNAKEGYQNVINAVGYEGLYNMIQGDPSSLALTERTLGLQSGGLQQLVTNMQQQKNLQAIQAAGATTRFVDVNGEWQDAKTGYAFTSPEDFQARTGMTLEQAQAKGMVGPLGLSVEQQAAQLDLEYKQSQIVENQAQTANQLRQAAGIRLGGGGGSGSSTGGAGRTSGGGSPGAPLSQEAQAVINGTLRLEDLTPTVRGKISGELNTAGYRSGPKLSAGQQDDLAQMDTVAQQINQILDYNNDGKLEGVGFGTGPMGGLLTKIFGSGSEEAKSVRALIGNIKGTIAKLRGGTSFTANEEKLLDSYVPTINESPASVINKLSLLNQFIVNKKRNLVSTAQERGVPNKEEDLRTKYNY